MRSSVLCCFAVVALFTTTLFAGTDPSDRAADAANTNANANAASTNTNPSAANANAPVPPEVTVVKSDIEQLRKQLADQQKTIERLQAVIEQLAAKEGATPASAVSDTSASASANAPSTDAASTPATTAAPVVIHFPSATRDGEDTIDLVQTPQAKKDALPTAGWNGEHFYLRSPDGTFTLVPLGYLNTNYNFYNGDGVPPNTFQVRRARFGFLGTYGSKVDYAFLIDAANTSSSGIAVRDMYINFKQAPQFQIQAGQFKEPFSQEVGLGITNVEFLERSIVTVLYPSAAGAFRAPGIAVHGDIDTGVFQYWGGIFNGKGLLANNTTNELETVGRVRFSPWKRSKGGLLKGFSFGGSISHSRSRALAFTSTGAATSPELSFSGALNDGAYTFFPQFRINGGIARYNGEFILLDGPFGLRGEYTQLLEKRDNVGSDTVGGLGFETVPGVVGKGAYGSATYLLTGEREPENAIPRVKHPVIGPPTPGVDGSSPGWGAWQVKFRYSWLEGKAGGQNFPNQFTPGSVPAFSAHTDQFAIGFNWYLNYWVLLKADLNIDRLHDPSVQGILPQTYFVQITGLQFRF